MKKRLLLSVSLFIIMTMALSAQRIDFDNRTSEVDTEPGYSKWYVNKCSSVAGTFADGNGNEISIEINCGGNAGHCLRANWWKDGVSKYSKLVGDCVAVYGLLDDGNTPNLTDESAVMNIVVSGLAPGRHSLLAYLNDTDGGIASVAPIDVLVNGSKVMTDVMMSVRAETPSASGQVYIDFSVAAGETVTVSLVSRPEGKAYGTSGVFVNALVFDRPNPKTTALDPYPANMDMHVDADNGTLEMRWTKAETAVRNLVYIGTSEDDMQLMAETDRPVYNAEGLSTHNVYYWRVDECDADGAVYTGDTWTFRPRRLAFPGAEGYGRYAIGGRGGSVYHVTSLDDYADGETPVPGTLRYGIKEVSGPRTVVFDVAGTVMLKSRLTCSDPYVTVAGQTAPGKGILLRGAPFGMAGDGITRFIRMRRGFHNDNVEDMDKGLDGLGMAGDNFSIMDHCSVGWTVDEAFSSRNAKNITLQRTLISETLNNANHPNYTNANHGYAATIGGDTGSYHHNLLAHNEGRCWSLSGGLDGKGAYAGHHDIFNNVVYNWGGRATDGGTHECNFVENYYKMGPATTQKYLLRAQLEGTGTGSQSYYVKGNIRENRDGSLTYDAMNETYRYETYNGQKVDWDVFVSQPFFESHANIEPAKLAFKTVLSDVGANQPYFDEHDARMVEETVSGTAKYKGSRTGKAGIIDRETDSEGYDYFYVTGESRSADFDTDGDGMPDWWENLNRLNPAVPDNNSDEDGNGYTALEEYLCWLAEPHYTVMAGVENRINLKELFAGFDNEPSYSYASTGDCSLSMVDGTFLAVTPEAGVNKLVTISVTADDNDNVGTMTRNINLHITDGTSGFDRETLVGGVNADYNIYNVGGTLVRQGGSLEGLASGIYILKVRGGESAMAFKIVVE